MRHPRFVAVVLFLLVPAAAPKVLADGDAAVPASAPADPADGAALAQARSLLARTALVDGHNDLPWTIREAGRGDLASYDLRAEREKGDTDLPRLAVVSFAASSGAFGFLPDSKRRRAPSSNRSTSRGA